MIKQIVIGLVGVWFSTSSSSAQKLNATLIEKNKTTTTTPKKRMAKNEKTTPVKQKISPAKKSSIPIKKNKIEIAKKDNKIVETIAAKNIEPKKNIEPTPSKEIQEKATEIPVTTNTRAIANNDISSARVVKKKPADEIDQSLIYANGFKISKNKFGVDYATYISDYVTNYHNNFGSRMSRIKSSNKKYFSLIENIMRKHGIPKEFKSLCVIESGLNPNAVSPVGAVGPWQFMEPTAKNMGLRVDEELDERRDFYKSTIAAAKFCKRLNNMFNDWLLVVASYNCGPAPVIRALNNTGGKSFWDIKKYLPKETQNHVMAFIATSAYYDKNTKILEMGKFPSSTERSKIKEIPIAKATKKVTKVITPIPIAKNDEQEELPIPPPDPNDPQMTESEMKSIVSVRVRGAFNIEAIAFVLDVDLDKIRRWNPNFNEKALTLKEPIKLILPNDKVETFIIEKDEILKRSLKNPKPISVPGSKIANAVNLRAKLAEKEREKQKTELAAKKESKEIVPVSDNNIAKKTIPKEKAPKKYTVKEGDNLNIIAEQFGMTVARIMILNKLTTANLQVGHTLYLE